MQEERINKAIKFFRQFSHKSDNSIYRKSVLKFCDLVESYMAGESEEEELEKKIDEVFGDTKESGGASS